jgi:hypothetical protein
MHKLWKTLTLQVFLPWGEGVKIKSRYIFEL